MPFFNPLSKTAPGFDRNLGWPIDGTAYVAVLTGPAAGGLFGGLFTPHLGAMGIGLFVGIGLTVLTGLLSDRFLDPWIARNQRFLLRIGPRIFVNIVVFAWALLLSGISMLAPIFAFGVFSVAQN